jgi:hypothetical protein
MATAGRYTCRNERGTMAMPSHGPIQEVFFGSSCQQEGRLKTEN